GRGGDHGRAGGERRHGSGAVHAAGRRGDRRGGRYRKSTALTTPALTQVALGSLEVPSRGVPWSPQSSSSSPTAFRSTGSWTQTERRSGEPPRAASWPPSSR